MLRKIMFIFLFILAAILLFAWLGTQPIKHFGKLPSGERLARIQASPNYFGGEFRYPVPTPTMAGDEGKGGMREFFFGNRAGRNPKKALPALKTNLFALEPDKDQVVWLGHSSFYMQLGAFKVLVDPVFSKVASPVKFTTHAFPGTMLYGPDDMPDIDLMIISHDHWDHLDYRTVMALKDRVKKIICPLGVGSHLEYWGVAPEKIMEGDWYDSFEPAPGLKVTVTPARHFSGRFLQRNRTLWASFVLETPVRRVFYSGDTGYGPHFAEIAARFGDFDLAIMENGQYNLAWHYVHMLPEEGWQASTELGAKAVLPVHAGKFSISIHHWQEPYELLYAASLAGGPALYTPIIGQPLLLGDNKQEFSRWWEEYEE